MRKVINLLGYTSIFLFILSFAIAITINFTPLYAFDIGYLGIEEATGLGHSELMENYRVLLRYLNLPWVDTLSMPSFPSSESGLFHFYEVKRLFLFDYLVLLLTGLLSFLFLHWKKREGQIWETIRPFMLMAILPLVLLFLIFVNFDRLFVVFHELFFNNDAWLFDYRTDPVILALPQGFFMHCFILVFILMEVGLWGFYFWAKRQTVVRKTTLSDN